MSPTTEDLKGWNNSRIKPNFKIRQMDSAQEINLPKETIYKNGLKKVTELTWKESVEDRFSSVHFSHSVVSDSLWPHELQHARPPCPSPTLGVHPNSSPLSWWCHPAISSCHPLLLLPLIPPSNRVFSSESTLRMRWPKYWSFSFSITPSKEHPGLIDLL